MQLYEPCFIRDQRPVSHSKSSWVNASAWAVPQVTLPTVCHGHATALVSQAQAVSFRTQPAELELTIWHPSLAGYAWPGLPTAEPARHGAPGPRSHFADYKSAAYHSARSPACNKSNWGLHTVPVVSRPSDRDGGGPAVAAGP